VEGRATRQAAVRIAVAAVRTTVEEEVAVGLAVARTAAAAVVVAVVRMAVAATTERVSNP